MGKIQRMSDELASLISAGEVVERPSSVVKELLENSIDAQAKDIKIYLKTGGVEEIKIVDDGIGMDKDDVLMSFMPHATSKIKNKYDLYKLNTLGFRGEAIASIALVSKMSITSSTDGVYGYTTTYKFGNKIEEKETSSNKGTTVVVNNLFINTPARLKYLKSEKTEYSSILFYVEREALAHPDIRFTLYNDNKMSFYTTGSNKMENLIYELYGAEASKNIIDFNFISDGYKARLVLLKPSIYRSNKLELSLVVNGRYVKNYNIINAVISAFETFLPINKIPVGIIYIDIDPLLIDCNVHPNKVEIKISNEKDICDKLIYEIKEELKKVVLIPTRNIDNNVKYENISIFEDHEIKENVNVYNQEKPKAEPVNIPFEFNVNNYDDEIKKEEKIINEPKEQFEDKYEGKKLPYLEYVGNVFGTYLIFQNSEGMYLIDQHAAAERVNYEKYLDLLCNPNQPITDLIVPIVLNVTKSEEIYIENNNDKFENIGFKIDSIGDKTFAVRSIPLWANVDNIDSILYDIISKMIDEDKIDIKYFRHHIAASIACKASIKANHVISKIEVDSLLENLNKCKNPYTCPHGRPTIIKITITELEMMFERIQK